MLTLRDAVCRAIFVADVGRSIDLDACRRLVPDLVRVAEARTRSPSLMVEPLPLRLALTSEPMEVDGRAVLPEAAAGVYEFGAIAVTLSSPLSGSLDDARQASCALAGHPRLASEARRLVVALLARIGPAVADLDMSDLAEDYIVLTASEWSSDVPTEGLHAAFAEQLAGILRSERGSLADEEIALATGTRVSRTPDDLVLLDWNAAIVLNRDPAPVLAVLELVNVQLLEMRLLDRRLDHSLERSYELLVRRNAWRSVRQPHSLREAMLHTGMLQVDATLLYERVGNAQKIVGDEYLARLYRRAAVRFGLATWHETIEKKLRTVGEIYERVHDRVVTTRLEILEWIVIALIAVEVVISLLH